MIARGGVGSGDDFGEIQSVHAKPETVSESQHTDQSSTREWFRCAVEATFRILRSRGHPLRISEILAHLLKEEENVPVWMGVNHLESLITWSDRVSQLSFQLSCSPPIRPELSFLLLFPIIFHLPKNVIV